MMNIFPLRQTQRVYCAGPLFNEAERREMSAIAEVLRRSGYEPFVPHADGLEFARVQPYLAEQGYDAVARFVAVGRRAVTVSRRAART